jgi:hypothetical protein
VHALTPAKPVAAEHIWSMDPAFAAKLREVSRPPAHTFVLSVNEKSQI